MNHELEFDDALSMLSRVPDSAYIALQKASYLAKSSELIVMPACIYTCITASACIFSLQPGVGHFCDGDATLCMISPLA
jgi:hypothetical protein